MSNKFYITAAIPYVNGIPHAGHALEFVQCDVMARFKKQQGFDVYYVSGSDENGLKIVQAAEKLHLTPQQLADKNTEQFKKVINLLDVKVNAWRRGSDKELHWPGTKKLWELCKKDIEKKTYGGFYCVGCEDFYTKKDLVDGKCPEHLITPEWVEEENYFFMLSRYEQQIKDLIITGELQIIPRNKKSEALSFVHQKLQDFSISRTKQRAKNWGIPVPGDNTQVIYTWFDALNIYQTAIGFGYDKKLWNKWWPADVHVIGKGILRFHAIYWIGMLLSAKLKLPKKIFVHGYISSGGVKMSKSLGNVIDPFEVVQKYGTDATRYYLLREIPAYSDGDFTFKRFDQLYNADLANGLGNLVSRVAKLCEKNNITLSKKLKPHISNTLKIAGFEEHLERFEFNLALEEIWRDITALDKRIELEKPWAITSGEIGGSLKEYALTIRNIAYALKPFLPQTAETIETQFSGKITTTKPLFPRI